MTTTAIHGDGRHAMSTATYLWNLLLEQLPVQAAKAGSGLRCEPGVVVKTPTRLKIGRRVVLQRRALLHCGGKAWCDYRGSIELADGVVVGPGCVLYGAGGIRVGRFSHFGPHSMVMTQSGMPARESRFSAAPEFLFAPVEIGEGVWIGAGAVILGGTTLGDGCTIGPNSVVQGSYDAGTSLIGNPARAVRITPPQGAG